jgi:hypothetical protein
MSLIKPRTRGKQFVRHRTRLDRENTETLYAYARFLSSGTAMDISLPWLPSPDTRRLASHLGQTLGETADGASPEVATWCDPP